MVKIDSFVEFSNFGLTSQSAMPLSLVWTTNTYHNKLHLFLGHLILCVSPIQYKVTFLLAHFILTHHTLFLCVAHVNRSHGELTAHCFISLCVSGRAIRHVNDYAAVLLVDTRYTNTSDSKRNFSRPTTKLPEWIKARLASTDNYGELHRMLHQFFKYNKNRGF